MDLLGDQHFAAQQPPLFDATPSSLKEDAEELIAETIAAWDSIVSQIQTENATFLTFYSSTSPSKDLRDASTAVGRLFNDAEIELYSRQDMFERVDQVLQQQDKQVVASLDEESLYYIQKLHRRFHQNGCGIAEEGQRVTFKTKMKRLGHLVQQCNKNLNEDKSGVWLGLDELDGIPQSLISRLKQGDGENSDHLWLPTKVPFSSPAITNAKSEATRKRIYCAIQNRMEMNVPLFREIVLLRDETARLLGYADHATLKTADKMMQTPQAVEALLSEIRTAVAPLAAQDVEELLEIKRNEAESRGTTADELYFWDLAYYSARRGEAEKKISSSISEYFELNTTLAKLLSIIEHLFGTRFRRVNAAGRDEAAGSLIWHKDVQMYSVWNVDGPKEFLGTLFSATGEPPRPPTPPQSLVIPTALQGYENTDGSLFLASSALVMNYVRPTDTRPTLLSLDEVRKLFHEIGHLLHSQWTQTKYAALHHVDRDFVEAPSMMLEQFFWVEQHIKDVSFHYSHINSKMKDMWKATLVDQDETNPPEKPAQLSDDVVFNLARANQSKAIQGQLKEVFFATYDMLVHKPASRAALEALNLTELFNKTRSDVYKVRGGEALGEGWEWGHGQTVFRNILNRYDAGYYSYLLGRVFAMDIFDAGFKEKTTSREAGRRYRDMVYRVGGRQAEMKTMTDYLGHEPSTHPYLAWLQGTRIGDSGPTVAVPT
uniref:Oligopeptidase PhomG n=1 Tax=Diaporthe leptostromiformis TaxID=291059 RepID=PHOG1_DIALO|nr:RecName: Full=Oligopeptidase PhomG; AltName: Full=Phomopsin biosynthesis cluster protein G [Diaporthe leptostromiformis]BDA39153.1 peptidase M3 [Diaporthe leptostromiformis]